MDGPVVDLFLTDPKPRLLIGYGSGVIPQADRRENSDALLDYLVIVDDQLEYIQSMKYQGLLGSVSAAFCDRVPMEVAYFPNSVLPGTNRGYKLGIVDRAKLIARLKCWNGSFYIPGRLQKPTKILSSDQACLIEFEEAQRSNLRNALIVGSILSSRYDNHIADLELFRSIVSLSYIGDIRVGIAENPHKIDNILLAQKDQLRSLYSPFFQDVGIVETGNGRLSFSRSPRELWTMLPEPFKRVSVQSSDPRESLRATLTNINRRESLQQAIGGIGTAGLMKSAKYLARKLSKRIFIV